MHQSLNESLGEPLFRGGELRGANGSRAGPGRHRPVPGPARRPGPGPGRGPPRHLDTQRMHDAAIARLASAHGEEALPPPALELVIPPPGSVDLAERPGPVPAARTPRVAYLALALCLLRFLGGVSAVAEERSPAGRPRGPPTGRGLGPSCPGHAGQHAESSHEPSCPLASLGSPPSALTDRRGSTKHVGLGKAGHSSGGNGPNVSMPSTIPPSPPTEGTEHR